VTARTYRQRRNGRLGWLHALLHRERELRDVRAWLTLEAMRHRAAKQELASTVQRSAGYLARIDKATAELATLDKAYDEIGDRLVRAEAKLAGRDAWIRGVVYELQFCVDRPGACLSASLMKDLLDTAPSVGETKEAEG